MRHSFPTIALTLSIFLSTPITLRGEEFVDSIPKGHEIEKTDSSTVRLKEVTVESDNQLIKGNTITYFPSANARKSASDAVNLLQRMAVPSIMINPVTNDISTTDGEAATLFIDFVKASEADIKGLRGKDVKQVDVIDFPTDPRFRGARHVVNIILRRQEYGGYTKLQDTQEFVVRDDNRGSVFSRLSNRKMTYDLYAGANYNRSKHGGMNQTTTYRLNGGTVEKREEVTDFKEKFLSLPVSFKAAYNTDKMQIVNTIGYGFSETYHRDNSGRLFFVPSFEEDEYSYSEKRTGHSNSISYTGDLYFMLPRNWNLSISPYLAYTRSHSLRTYSSNVNGFEPIVTNGTDNALNTWLYVTANKIFSGRHTLNLTTGVYDMANRISYSGTTDASSKVNRLEGYAGINYQFYSGRKINGGGTLSTEATRTWTPGRATTNLTPSISLWVSYNPTSKSRFLLSGAYKTNDMSYGAMNDILIRVNEFEYRQGNTAIEPFTTTNVRLTYTYLPMNAFTMSAYTVFNYADNMFTPTYLLNRQLDAIVVSSSNMGFYKQVSAGMSLIGKLFSNRLVISGRPQYVHTNVNNFFRIVDNRFSFSADAQFYAGNFSFSAYYNHKVWTIYPFGGTRNINPSYYYVEGTWSDDHWNISLKVQNFFRRSYIGQVGRISSEYYSQVSDINIPSYHANLSLRVIYTFGYGKEIARGNEVGAQSSAGTIL